MSSADRRYKKTAGIKAKEYLINKRRYKTKEEKTAFRIAERFRVNEWREKIYKLDAQERQAQLKAFRYYRLRINLIPLLIGCAVLALMLIAALIVLL